MSDELKRAVTGLRAAATTPGETKATARLAPLLEGHGAVSRLARETGLDKGLVSRQSRGLNRPTLFDASVYEVSTGGVVRPNDWLTDDERAFLKQLHPGAEVAIEVRDALDLCRSVRERLDRLRSSLPGDDLRVASAEQALSQVESALEHFISRN